MRWKKITRNKIQRTQKFPKLQSSNLRDIQPFEKKRYGIYDIKTKQ